MPKLIEDAVKTKKKILLSGDDQSFLKIYNLDLEENFDGQIDYLWCQPVYPTTCKDFRTPFFANSSNYKGVSLHTVGLYIPLQLLKFKPEWMEVHVKGVGASGPDTDFALTLNELKELCDSNKSGIHRDI